MKRQRWKSTDRSIELELETADLEIEELGDDLPDDHDELAERIDRRAV